MADRPHWSLPFRFNRLRDGSLEIPVTEEESLEEIGDCVELLLRTEQGERETLPGFGRPEMLAFATNPELAESLTQQALDDYEPRWSALIERDTPEEGVLHLLIQHGLEESAE